MNVLDLATLPKNQLVADKNCCYKITKKNGEVWHCPSVAWMNSGLCYEHYQKVKSRKTNNLIKPHLPEGLDKIYDQYVNDPDLLDLRDVLGLLKGILLQALKEIRQRQENDSDSLESVLDGPNLKKILDIVKQIVATASSVEDIERKRGYVIDAKQANVWLVSIAKIINVNLSDNPDKLQKIVAEIESVPFRLEKGESDPLTFNTTAQAVA